MNRPDIESRLGALRAKFASKLPDRVAEIKKYWTAARTASKAAARQDNMVDLQRLVHLLAGSGSSFGFPSITEAALPLETILQELVDSKATATPDDAARITSLIDDIERIVE